MEEFKYPLKVDIGHNLILQNSEGKHASGLEMLQDIVFPLLSDSEKFRAPHYLKHIDLFPEGQFCVTDGDLVVGMTTTIRMTFDFNHCQHRFEDVIDGGYLTSHQPDGEWLYGMDVGTHPDYRRRGIAKALYRARQALAKSLGLKGQVTVGMMNGYGEKKHQYSPEEYFEKIKSGEEYDPTVSTQMKLGFKPMQLIPDYLDDPTCDNFGVLIALDVEKDF